MIRKSISFIVFFGILTGILDVCSGVAFAETASPTPPAEPMLSTPVGNSASMTPLGFWYTEGRDGVVQIYSCDEDTFCGRMYWLQDDDLDNVSRDDKNPDPTKRHRPLCQMEFMSGFKHEKGNRYTNGKIYSPRHGADFHAVITQMDPDTLELYGYVVMPLLGKGQKWKRAQPPVPECTTADAK